jgi:hypothetical protein
MFKRRKQRKGLAKLIDALGDPQEVQDLLETMPTGLARSLRPLLTIAIGVSRLYRDETAQIPEPPNGLQAGRARLMAAVGELQVKRQRRYQAQARWALRFAGAVIALVILLVPTGVYAFRASDQSLPGQALYPLKHSQESYMLRRTGEQPGTQVALTMSFTDERIREMQVLTGKGRPIPTSVVISVDNLTRRAVEAAAWTPEPMMNSHLQIIAWHNQNYIHALEALKAETTAENLDAISSAQAVLANRYLITNAALEQPGVFRAAYQAGKPEKLATPGGGPLGAPEPTQVIEDILETPPPARPTDVPAITASPTPGPSTPPDAARTPLPAEPDGPPTDNPGVPADPADPGEPGEPADPADPNNPDTPPGQDNRPGTPPGQEESPSDPPGQDNRPGTPPGQEESPSDPPGNDKNKGNNKP